MSSLLNFSLQNLIDRLPIAAYAVQAPDGIIAWYNDEAAKLWGRRPQIGDLDERFCGSYRLYHPDGTFMAHSDTPVAHALATGDSFHQEDVVIERPDGSRVTVCVHIDPVLDDAGTIIGVTNFFFDVTERKIKEGDAELKAMMLELALKEKGAELRKREDLSKLASRKPVAGTEGNDNGADLSKSRAALK